MQIAMEPSHTNIVLGALVLAALVGCAAAPSPPPSQPQAENLLTVAGFKTVVASTDKQVQMLPTLPAGQVTVVTQTGKNYFVYPDVAKNRIYVGNEKEYQAYLRLRAQYNMPPPNPEGSYVQQDAAMRKADARDASVPWFLWPDFSGLGW
jgi:hypothetical protein